MNDISGALRVSRIFTSLDAHNQALLDSVTDDLESCCVSTYGLWAGVTHDGRDLHDSFGGKFSNPNHTFLDALSESHVPSRVMVGLPEFFACNKDRLGVSADHLCGDCIDSRKKALFKLHEHVKRWPSIKWKFGQDLHMKLSVFKYRDRVRIIMGGRNMTNSSYSDLSLELVVELGDLTGSAHCVTLMEKFRDLWNSPKFLDVTLENLTGRASLDGFELDVRDPF